MAASFNMSLVKEMGQIFGIEMRAFNDIDKNLTPGLTSWGPTVNLVRDPRWGRNQESPGECPTLAGKYGAAFSSGMQGDDPKYLRAAASLKHFTAYSLEDYDNHTYTRQTFNSIVSAYDLGDSYFPAFKRAIQEGGATGIMYAVNEVNGIPSAGNQMLFEKLASWGFDGYRCSDGGQVSAIYTNHHYANNITSAIKDATYAQCDIDDGPGYADHLPDAIGTGQVEVTAAQQLLFNSMKIRFRVGLFDPPENQPYMNYTIHDINSTQHDQTNLFATSQALVLLKNDDNVLPFSSQKSVAVIGPPEIANTTASLGGNYEGKWCATPGNDCFPNIVQAISALNSNTQYSPGGTIQDATPEALAAAVNVAKEADQVVLVLGDTTSQEGEQHDRFNITLPVNVQKIADAILALDKPLAVVLIHGGAMAIPSVKAKAGAILDGFFPGVRSGESIAKALFGIHNPGGKLPYTVYDTSYQHLVNFTNMSMTAGCGRTYRYYDSNKCGAPLWEFGFGLSYTTFNLSWRETTSQESTLTLTNCTSSSLSFNFSVSNTGSRDGDEVAQIYHQPVPGSLPPAQSLYPKKHLIDFQRFHIAEGEAKDWSFVVTPQDMMLTQVEDGLPVFREGLFDIIITRGHGDVLTQRIQTQICS
eukprot:m.223296 g.223296  ORF g.223296 m.223296 type:complete len:643 (-) comp26343_c2_seq2:91-2019(-)